MIQLGRKKLLQILMGQFLLWAGENCVIGVASYCKVVQTTPHSVCFNGPSHLLAHFIVTLPS